MDNLTHSLAGIVTAEAIVQVRARTGATIDPRWHRAAWLVSAGAHNAPDLDFAYAWITEGKLGYLLHHRGHTHTLALAPLMAALAYLVVYAWARRGRAWTRAEHGWALAIAALGPIGHVLLDLSNNYGVHPLWPIDDRWYAGDTIFIVEPLFWAVTIPPVLFATRSRPGRIAWAAALAIGLALPWLAPLVSELELPWGAALTCTVLAVIVLLASVRAPAIGRVAIALAGSALVLGTFTMAGASAEALARAAIARERPRREILDVVRSPMPTLPLCWEMVIVTREGARYQLSLARVTSAPAIMSAEVCARTRRRETTAPVAHDVLRAREMIVEAEHEASHDALRALAARCDVHAFLRFARAPYFVSEDDRWIVGDLRYDREPSLEFAEMDVPLGTPRRCPEHVPPWVPWREDLLGP